MAPKGGFPGITNSYYERCISRSNNQRIPASPSGLGEHSLRQFQCRDYKSSYLVMSIVWSKEAGRPSPLPFYFHSHKMSRPLLHLLMNNTVSPDDFCNKVRDLDFELLAQTSELDADTYGPTFIGSMDAYLTSESFQGKVLLLKLRKLNLILSEPGAYENHYQLVMGLPISHSFDAPVDAEPTTLGLPKSFLRQLVRTRCNRLDATQDRIAEAMLLFLHQTSVFKLDQLDLESPLVGTIEWVLQRIRHHPDFVKIGQEFVKLMMLNSRLLFQHDYACYDQYLNFVNNTAVYVSIGFWSYDVTFDVVIS